MTPEKRARLATLQGLDRIRVITGPEHDELEQLRRELAASPEVADDPRTLFVDESSRPQLDGSDYNDTLKRICCDEVTAVLKKGLETLGREGLKVLVDRVLYG